MRPQDVAGGGQEARPDIPHVTAIKMIKQRKRLIELLLSIFFFISLVSKGIH